MPTFGGTITENQWVSIPVTPELRKSGYRTYTGSTSVMRGAVFGRIAGLDAAARKNRPR